MEKRIRMPVDIVVSKEGSFNKRKSLITIEHQIEKDKIFENNNIDSLI